MTRGEILNLMPGEELDALIAEKVFGHQMDGDTLTDGKRCWPLPQYSTSFQAAWLVAEYLHMGVAPCHYGYAASVRRYKGEDGKWVHLSPWFWSPQHNRCPGVVAQTAPLAICRCALLYVLNPGE